MLYSGKGTGGLAQVFAAERGLMTIGDTEGGAYLRSFGNLFDDNISPVTRDEAYQLWRYASEQYARGASGVVRAFLNNPEPLRIYLTVERPILIQNADVVLQELGSPDSIVSVGNFH